MAEIEKILDSLLELIYVADLNTYDMLYLNKTGREYFHHPHIEGQKCYQVLQHLDSPCPFCTNPILTPGKVYAWEFSNPVVNRHFFLKDQLVDWNGKNARMEIAFDTTELKQEKDELKNRLEIEQLIVRCSQELFLNGQLQSAVDRMLEALGLYTQADRAYLVVLHDGHTEWHSEWCREGLPQRIRNTAPRDRELYAFWKNHKADEEILVLEDISHLKHDSPLLHESFLQNDVGRIVITPLEKDGVLLGFMGLDNPSSDKFSRGKDLFQTLRYFISLSICREKDTERLSFLSYQDPLTGLFNRNRFSLDTQELADQNTPVGILYMNINGLKEMNDQHGHAFGDQVINTFGERISRFYVRDAIYRTGGDEFIVLSHTEDELEFRRRALLFQKEIVQNTPCSIAVGYHWTSDSENIHASVAVASAMMYEEKRKHYLTQTASIRYRRQNDPAISMNSAEKLKKIIENGQLLVYLQPKFSFIDESLVGAEAVVRFHSDEGEIVYPGRFLPEMEELRLISFIDFYMFEQICKSLRSWAQRGFLPVPVAVNFSRHSLTEINFISRLSSLCQSYEVPKSLFEIEITESVDSVPSFNLKLFNTQLQEEGYRVVIDDFGARYANLSLLTSAPFDKLKIDKSLVDTIELNEKARTVIRALAFLCNNLKIETTVEGVETLGQFTVLKDMGFQEVQGFLFSKPIPLTEFEEKYLSPGKS